MAHHHLCIVKFGLDLTAFIRSVQCILPAAIHLPIANLLAIWAICCTLVGRLIGIGRRSSLIGGLLVVKVVLLLSLQMARRIVVPSSNRDILRLNTVVS